MNSSIFIHTDAEREFTEFTFRWLQAMRDFPGVDVGPMPEHKPSPGFACDPTFGKRAEELQARVRSSCIREFERST